MTGEQTFLWWAAGEWTAIAAVVTALATVGVLGVAIWVGVSEMRRARSAASLAATAQAAENRARVLRGREDAVRRASTLYVEPLHRDAERIALRATGEYEFTDVTVQWIAEGGLIDCHESPFDLSPSDDRIKTVVTPTGWEWPPTYVVRYYDSMGRYFVRIPERPPILVMDPTETDEDRIIAGALGRPHWLPPGP